MKGRDGLLAMLLRASPRRPGDVWATMATVLQDGTTIEWTRVALPQTLPPGYMTGWTDSDSDRTVHLTRERADPASTYMQVPGFD